MMDAKTQLQDVQERLAQLDPNSRDHLAEIQRLKTQENELIKHVEQVEEQQAREQKFVQHIDALAQQIQDMDLFGALLPREPFEKLIGLEEYGEKQQDLNKTLYAWATLIQKQVFEEHTAEVSGYQSQVRELKEKNRAGEDRELQLKRQNDELQEALEEEKTGHEEALNLLNGTKAQLNEVSGEVDQLKQQLSEAQKAKPTLQADQSFADQIAELRNKSIKSSKELALEGNTFRGKVTFEGGLPEVVAPAIIFPAVEAPNQGGTFPLAQFEGNQLHVTGPVENTGIDFREETEGNGLPVVGDTTLPENDGKGLTIEEIDARLKRVEAQLGIAV